MIKLALPLAAAALIPGLALIPPAQAQSSSAARISEIIVYGNDPCPRSTDSEVVVCARKPETERYRLPPNYRPSGSRQSRQSWANRAKSFETVGATGINSCSAVGPGGSTGCLEQLIDRARAERREQVEGMTPPEQ